MRVLGGLLLVLLLGGAPAAARPVPAVGPMTARGGGVATPLSTDPLLDWPSNLAFGRGGRGFVRRDLYLVNFGLPLGSGTTIVRAPYRTRGTGQ